MVRGVTAEAAGPLDDNLVLKAARALAAKFRGSSSAASRWKSACRWRRGWAAARRMRRRRFGCWRAPIASSSTDKRLLKVARGVGADVPVCVDPRPRRMRGIGEMLSAPLAMPKLPAVLVNPGVAVPTRDVFELLGLKPGAAKRAGAGAALPRADEADRMSCRRAQRSRAGRDRAPAGDRPGACGVARASTDATSRACRARARHALDCCVAACGCGGGARIRQRSRAGG